METLRDGWPAMTARPEPVKDGAAGVQAHLMAALGALADGFATLDRDGRLIYLNRAGEGMLGDTCVQLHGAEIWSAFEGADRAALRRRLRAALENGAAAELEIRHPVSGRWLELRAHPSPGGLAVLMHDITARRQAREEMERLAFYDALTGLPNRQLLLGRLSAALARVDGQARMGALMFIDLDHFKALNDTAGHSKGDLLLQVVASRLQACVGEDDTVARLGGDEFVVMLEGLGDDLQVALALARTAGRRILAAMSAPCDLAGHEYHGSCSIGITLFGKRRQAVGELLKQADLAVYQAKAWGRNEMRFFDPSMRALASRSAAMVFRLREAMRRGEFVLHYQPQVGPGGAMTGAEALLRWRDPRRGLVQPDAFISQAEESGLIVPLGKWVLDAACAQLARWAGRPETAGLGIAVNVSARQFRQPDFVAEVMSAIASAGIDPKRLKLELTESVIVSPLEATVARMQLLKAAGVQLSIDDFCVGYSALSYLKHMPLDEVKIDRSFVRDILTDATDAAIARTIIGLAQGLGLALIAEGVETEEQRQFLASHGCHSYQGYLFSRPLPVAELEALMRTA